MRRVSKHLNHKHAFSARKMTTPRIDIATTPLRSHVLVPVSQNVPASKIKLRSVMNATHKHPMR